MGETTVHGAPFCRLDGGKPEGAVQGNVFGTYLHGLFDTGELTERLAQWLLSWKGLAGETGGLQSHRACIRKSSKSVGLYRPAAHRTCRLFMRQWNRTGGENGEAQ